MKKQEAIVKTNKLEIKVHSLGRVEGDLDVKVAIDDGVVVDAWTEATMFRGFEMILKGKDPQAGLIVTPRICGICGGSHLTKAVYALDTAWGRKYRRMLRSSAILLKRRKRFKAFRVGFMLCSQLV